MDLHANPPQVNPGANPGVDEPIYVHSDSEHDQEPPIANAPVVLDVEIAPELQAFAEAMFRGSILRLGTRLASQISQVSLSADSANREAVKYALLRWMCGGPDPYCSFWMFVIESLKFWRAFYTAFP